VVTAYPDGSARYAALVAVLGDEQLTAAVARC
jgi:hypothetical protein